MKFWRLHFTLTAQSSPWPVKSAGCSFERRYQGRLLEQSLRHEAAVLGLSFSPDGRRLLCTCADGRARLWETDGWTTVAEFPFRAEGGSAAYHPAGRSVAIASPDGTARLWDADDVSTDWRAASASRAGRLPDV